VTVVKPLVVTFVVGEQVGFGTAMDEELSVAIPKSAAKPKPQTIALRLAARGFKNCVVIHL
jgi:ribosomal protein S5